MEGEGKGKSVAITSRDKGGTSKEGEMARDKEE